MIDRATVQKITDTADIVEVVSDYVHLVRKGANYMGLCPFHNERTPSFSVNKAKNYCYCFSCHKGGSPVNFIMEKEGLTYREALLQLAKKYGITVEEKELTDEEREQLSRREGMFIANEWAMNYLSDNLTEKEEGKNIGLQYLYGRKVTPEAIRQFHLGYAIDKSTDLLDAALKKGFSKDILKALGLIGTSQQGHDYDKFRGRVIYPVMNSSGKVVAFGGRDLKGSNAKYINSQESDIYVKSNELYGIFQARSSIVREDKCFLVEGYHDVIGIWQSGIKNVVASSGTALTDSQINLIHRFTENVTLIYDGDAAGIKASLRGIDMLLSHNLNVKVLLLPEGEDPDSFAASHSPEEFKEYLEKHETDIIRFKTQVLLNESSSDPQKRNLAIRSIVTTLAHISDKIKRDIYIQECSILLKISEATLTSEVANLRRNIVQQEKIKRNRAELERREGGKPTTADPHSINGVHDSFNSDQNVSESNLSQKKNIYTPVNNPLRPLEWTVLENCLKYGFLKLWDDEENNGDETFITALEFIDDELNIDEISFSEPDFKKTYEEMVKLIPSFRADFKEYYNHLLNESETIRKEGIHQIADKGLSLSEIRVEEEKLENNIFEFVESRIEEFCRNYIPKILGSHPDNEVRTLTLKALTERHKLSNLFTKDQPKETNGEKILPLLLTSLNVLKNGILELELSSLMSRIKDKTHSLNDTEEKEISLRIAEILQIRNKMAKDIGERIVCPRK